MTEMREIGDLRAAPRTTPTALLWMLAAVMVAGLGLLVMEPGAPTADRPAAARPSTRQPNAADAAISRNGLAASANAMYWPLGAAADRAAGDKSPGLATVGRAGMPDSP